MSTHTPNLQTKYKEEVAPALMETFGYSSPMAIPRLLKINLNQGVNGAVTDKKLVHSAVEEMSLIAGQRAVSTIAKKSVSNFKLREGMPIGAKVTLRRTNMYEFLERLICVALPRVRDFRGVSEKGFDGRGNFTMGIKEQIIFPEIVVDKISNINGMDVTFVTSAKTDKEAYELLKLMGIPFKK
ncbi:MAG: 50S ribosomal protein L5 [Bacteroidetes bacterium]|nr:MAG: 50S ribosomal protein L5 [Bacteroidota bacterium]